MLSRGNLLRLATYHKSARNIQTSLSANAESTPSSKETKKTVLYDFHVKNNGKIVDFAGWLMPVQYKDLSIQESHLHTRSKCSLFDVSHMMQTKVYGKDRFKYIESLVVGDIKDLKPNSGTLTVYTNENGGIIDDLIVSNTSLDYLYIVSNAGCADKDFAHMKAREQEMRSQNYDVKLVKIEDKALVALQGPLMHKILENQVDFDFKKFPFMNTAKSDLFGIKDCRITRCGYTGEDGVEISVRADRAAELCNRLLDYQNGQVCKLAGLGARDTLRLEASLCLYGNDIDEKTTPVEAGLSWLIGKRRRAEANFPGASVILEQLKEKPKIRRVGIKMLNSSGPSARQHMKIFDENGDKELGEITSGGLSPSLKELIAMGYVKNEASKLGTKLKIEIRNKKHDAVICKMPFVKTNYYTVKN